MTGLSVKLDMVINGHRLTPGQAAAVQVAICDFLTDLQDPDACGDDEHGRRMRQAYLDRLSEVFPFLQS